MKNLILVLGFIFASGAHAQSTNWSIRDTGNEVISRTETYGISTRDNRTKQSRSALALACDRANNTAPFIYIQWENLQGYGPRKVNYTIDNNPPTANGTGFVMTAERDILYRRLDSSRELLQSMKTGSKLVVDWVGTDQTRYLATFNLSTFRSNLSEFNKKCNTDY